jgi:hypothetical protein
VAGVLTRQADDFPRWYQDIINVQPEGDRAREDQQPASWPHDVRRRTRERKVRRRKQ